METRQNSAERRLGVVAIIVNNRNDAVNQLNTILHNYASIIVGRLGLPYRERNLSIISLIVDGSSDELGAMTGQIGQIPHISVKTAFAKFPISG